MAEPKALVRNASDPEQVRKAKLTDKQEREQELRDLSDVMDLPVGRRVLSRIIALCKVFQSPFDSNGSRMNYNVGQQDVGRTLIAECTTANKTAWMQMQRESLRVEEMKVEPAEKPEDE